MLRFTLSLSGLVLVGSAFVGCQANPSGRTPIVTIAPTPTPVGDRGKPTPIDSNYVTWTRSGPVLSNTPYETSSSITFEFHPANGPNFRAMVAPVSGSTEPAICQVVPPAMDISTTTPATDPPATQPTMKSASLPEPLDISYGMLQDDGPVMGATPQFRIFAGSGYVLFNGARPHGETGRGEVTSDGATFIARPGKLADRFFLINGRAGQKMTVKALLGMKHSKTVSKLLHYVDVKPDGSIGAVTPIPLSTSDPTFQFVNQAVQAGIEAGFPSPPNWPPSLEEK